ncbi:MAG: hypothetical protein IIA35_01745 [Proteobacteria bacterium]|nr:hypothetical protein [Pseudomonadota bacterium]
MFPDTLRRALSYPYEIPANSYIVYGGEHQELSPCAPMPDVSGRRPVLAVGSNQSPEQLIRKFNGSDLGPIPVIRARLKDFDIVYSPHVASYGSIPATLRHSPGTRVTLFVNWLTPAQVARMHETEIPTGNYHFGELDGIELQLDFGTAMTSAYVYSSRRGSLTRDGFPVALAAVRAENRIWPSLSQEEIQNHARDITAVGQPLETFIRAAIEDVSVRQERTRALMSDGLPFNYSSFTSIEI